MREPVGVILAGGRGRRLGGAKATAPLASGTLLDRPLEAMRAALGPQALVAIVAKPGTPLPARPDTAVWCEPSEPFHPAVGLVCALERAQGSPVLVCPVDLPFVESATLARLARHGARPGAAWLALGAESGMQPLLGLWAAASLGPLHDALGEAPLPSMRAVAQRLGARTVAVDESELVNVNTPDDLAAARARISRR